MEVLLLVLLTLDYHNIRVLHIRVVHTRMFHTQVCHIQVVQRQCRMFYIKTRIKANLPHTNNSILEGTMGVGQVIKGWMVARRDSVEEVCRGVCLVVTVAWDDQDRMTE